MEVTHYKVRSRGTCPQKYEMMILKLPHEDHNGGMSRTHYFYFKHSVHELEQIVTSHQVEFDALLEECFSEYEMLAHEKMIDSIAAVYVQPILSELSFDDFYADEKMENEQRMYFSSARSSICLDHLPYFESNPFQVTYLKNLLLNFSEALIDRGGVHELVFKEQYLSELSKYKDIDSLIPQFKEKIPELKTNRPVDPIDFLILDVYREIDRLKNAGTFFSLNVDDQSEKFKKVFLVMSEEKSDSSGLLKKCGLNAKDFDDTLERLKFWLRKI